MGFGPAAEVVSKGSAPLPRRWRRGVRAPLWGSRRGVRAAGPPAVNRDAVARPSSAGTSTRCRRGTQARGAGPGRRRGVRPLQHSIHLRLADRPQAQDARRARRAVHDRGLDAHLAAPPVDDEIPGRIQAVPDLRDHVRRAGRADPAEAVRAGGGHTTRGIPGERHQRPDAGQGHRMVRAAQGDRRLAAGEVVPGTLAAGHDHRERARPEGLGERLGGGVRRSGPALKCRSRLDMDDQRVVDGPALGPVHPRHRFRLLGVGSQPVDGLGRQAHDAPRRPGTSRGPGHLGVGLTPRGQSGQHGNEHRLILRGPHRCTGRSRLRRHDQLRDDEAPGGRPDGGPTGTGPGNGPGQRGRATGNRRERCTPNRARGTPPAPFTPRGAPNTRPALNTRPRAGHGIPLRARHPFGARHPAPCTQPGSGHAAHSGHTTRRRVRHPLGRMAEPDRGPHRPPHTCA